MCYLILSGQVRLLATSWEAMFGYGWWTIGILDFKHAVAIPFPDVHCHV